MTQPFRDGFKVIVERFVLFISSVILILENIFWLYFSMIKSYNLRFLEIEHDFRLAKIVMYPNFNPVSISSGKNKEKNV